MYMSLVITMASRTFARASQLFAMASHKELPKFTICIFKLCSFDDIRLQQ
jgi:hypothetical protein